MSRESVLKALERGIERLTPSNKPRRKNKRPEKDVQKEVQRWAQLNNIFLHVVESKAVYSEAAGRYNTGQAEAGFIDMPGNNADGEAMYVELKAPGCRSNLSSEQYHFLRKKIDQKCFSVVVDSAVLLNQYYYSWKRSKNREAYLISILPIPKSVRREQEPLDF